MSWSASSTAVNVAGHKPTSTVVINSTTADPAKLAILENILYGKDNELTKTEPKNWSTDYKKYYTKSGDKFEAVTGESAPAWEENKYYDEATEPRLHSLMRSWKSWGRSRILTMGPHDNSGVSFL